MRSTGVQVKYEHLNLAPVIVSFCMSKITNHDKQSYTSFQQNTLMTHF